MPFVAFDVIAATAPHASRKPAAPADREGSTQFSDMLDKPDTIDHSAPKNQNLDQGKTQNLDEGAPTQAKPATESTEPDPATNAATTVSPDVTIAQVQPAETDAASETPATEQEIADFLAAVVAATGMKITPVVEPKADEKPTETKSDDKTDDATVTTDAAAPAETQSADAAAIVVTVQADATAAAPEETEAKSAGIAAATPEQTKAAAQSAVTAEIAIPGDTKDAKETKPQTAAKVDAPALTPNLTPDTATPETGKQTANPQAAQPAAQPQAAKPDAPAQAAKPAPTQHDVRAVDASTSTKPTDSVQPMVLVQNHTATAATDQAAPIAAAATTAPQAVALPVAGIAIEIAGKAMAGKNRFEIRLDPPELGKIHVQLDVDHKGEVTSIITADRSDTFDLLRRDAQALERALQDAGVKTSSNGLQFSLRDHGTGRHDQPAPANSARVIVRDDNLDTDTIAPVYRSFAGNRAGVDIRV